MSEEHEASDAIGTVTHWYAHLSVAAIRLTASLALGDRIRIKGHTNRPRGDGHVDGDRAPRGRTGRAGDDVVLAVEGHVREQDVIFREA